MSDRAIRFRGANWLAYSSREPEVLLAGPAGSGKSLVWLARLFVLADRYPGARLLICRKTRASLTETGLVTFERDVLGQDSPILTRNPVLRRVRQSYRHPNGSEIVVGGMDKPEKVLSAEYDVVYCQEVTEFTLEDWETLGGRLRSGVVPYQQLVADCNPTSPHFWLFKRQQLGLAKMYTSTHRDNPRYFDRRAGAWTPEGERYLARLGRMTGARRDRYLHGKWVAAEGVVYEFDPERHLHPAGWVAPREWVRVWGIDWGKTSPTVLCVWAVDPEGRMHAGREVYQTRTRPDRLGVLAKGWVESGAEPRPHAIVCDHDEERKADFEKASGLSLTLADKTDRGKGIEAMQARFDPADDGQPRVFLTEGARCHEADRFLVDHGLPTCGVEEIVGYVWDEDFLADEPIAENDHFCDQMRYVSRYVDSRQPHLADRHGRGTGRREREVIPT